MTGVTPIQQPPIEDLRNALQMALGWTDYAPPLSSRAGQMFNALLDIARLIRHALTELSEPNLAAMQAGAILLAEWQGTPEPQRQLRDTIQGILRAQLEGRVPKTWEEL